MGRKIRTTSKGARLPVMRLWSPRRLAYIHVRGRRYYLGPWGSREADDKYRALVRQLLGVAHTGPIQAVAPQDTVIEITTAADLATAYAAHAARHFVKRDRPTHTAKNAARVRDLVHRFPKGRIPIEQCTPLWLRELRTFIAAATRDTTVKPARSITRGTLNEYVAIVLRMFRFGASFEFCEPSLWYSLKALEPLKKGRPPDPNARPLPEGKPVDPVLRSWIQRTRRHLGRTVRIMLDVQLLTGMRPNELCWLRPCDLSATRAAGVTLYRVPAEANKTDHEEDAAPRTVWIGPRAMRLLSMLPEPSHARAFYFSPVAAATEFYAARSAARRVPMYDSHEPDLRRSRKRAAGRPPRLDREQYSPDSYRRAITRGCQRASTKASPIHFSPYQLRHNCATTIANREQIQVAQVMLGHRSISTTVRYVKPWEKHAVAAALRYG